MRRTLFLALTLLLTLGAVATSVPQAEAACSWICECGNLVCDCGFGQCGKEPTFLCPHVACI